MNPATAFAVTLVDELARCGLAEAVLAPGSRSAPLAIALWDRAAREPGEGGAGVRLHVRIDERSASFLALGLAKASRRPVALVCTSGTAAAHFHAAVIEASEAEGLSEDFRKHFVGTHFFNPPRYMKLLELIP